MWIFRRRDRTPARNLAGYDNRSLIDVVVRKTAALDDVARIDDVQAGETLLPTITGVAAAGGAGVLRVLDFGGAAGLHYRVARQVFPERAFRWAVIETPEMIAAAKALATPELQFFRSPAASMVWLEQVDLMHCVSALQYVDEPEVALDQLLAVGARTVLWAKLMLGDRRETFIQSSRLKDNGPGRLPPDISDGVVTYSATRICRDDFLAAHHRCGYRLAWKARESDTYLFFKHWAP